MDDPLAGKSKAERIAINVVAWTVVLAVVIAAITLLVLFVKWVASL